MPPPLVDSEELNQHFTRQFIKLLSYLEAEGVVRNQSDFAVQMGLTPNDITSIRKGRRRVNLEDIYRAVRIFDINVEWFLYGKGRIRGTGSVSKSETVVVSTADSDTALRLQHARREIELLEKTIEDKNSIISRSDEMISMFRRLNEMLEKARTPSSTDKPNEDGF